MKSVLHIAPSADAGTNKHQHVALARHNNIIRHSTTVTQAPTLKKPDPTGPQLCLAAGRLRIAAHCPHTLRHEDRFPLVPRCRYACHRQYQHARYEWFSVRKRVQSAAVWRARRIMLMSLLCGRALAHVAVTNAADKEKAVNRDGCYVEFNHPLYVACVGLVTDLVNEVQWEARRVYRSCLLSLYTVDLPALVEPPGRVCCSIQAIAMFIGEFLCYIAFRVLQQVEQRRGDARHRGSLGCVPILPTPLTQLVPVVAVTRCVAAVVHGTDGKITTISDKPFNRFLLMLPACCDMSATSVMYIGLTLVGCCPTR